MKLVTIDSPPSGRIGALLASGEILDIARARHAGTIEAWMPLSVREVLCAGASGMDAVRRVVDLPAGGDRLVADQVRGIDHVLVNGTVRGTGGGRVLRTAPPSPRVPDPR